MAETARPGMNMEDVSTAVKKHLDAQHVPIKYWQWDDKTVVLALVTAKEGAGLFTRAVGRRQPCAILPVARGLRRLVTVSAA